MQFNGMNRFNHGLFQYLYRKQLLCKPIIYIVGIIGLVQVLLIGLWVMIIYRLPSLLSEYDQWTYKLSKSRDFKERYVPDCTYKYSFLNINGCLYHYVSMGEGPLLLLLHGFPQNWFCWSKVMAKFSTHYKVVAIDLKGYGLSSKPNDISAYSEKVLLNDLELIIQQLGYSDATVCGYDWGGILAWSLAEKKPHLVTKLLLMNTLNPRLFHQNMTFTQLCLSYYMCVQQIPLLPQFLSQLDNQYWILEVFRQKSKSMSPTLMEYYRQESIRSMHDEVSMPIAANYYYRNLLMGGFDTTTRYDMSTKIPFLMLWSENEDLLEMETCISQSHCQVKMIPRAGHFVMDDAPEDVLDCMSDFLTSHIQ